MPRRFTSWMEWQAMQETPSSSKGRFLNAGLSVRAPEKGGAGLWRDSQWRVCALLRCAMMPLTFF